MLRVARSEFPDRRIRLSLWIAGAKLRTLYSLGASFGPEGICHSCPPFNLISQIVLFHSMCTCVLLQYIIGSLIPYCLTARFGNGRPNGSSVGRRSDPAGRPDGSEECCALSWTCRENPGYARKPGDWASIYQAGRVFYFREDLDDWLRGDRPPRARLGEPLRRRRRRA
jgi:hypothetical protein